MKVKLIKSQITRLTFILMRIKKKLIKIMNQIKKKDQVVTGFLHLIKKTKMKKIYMEMIGCVGNKIIKDKTRKALRVMTRMIMMMRSPPICSSKLTNGKVTISLII